MKLNENIVLPIKVGDTILTGRFKNKRTTVKSIGKDDYGMPTINGRKVVNFRIVKESIEVEFPEDMPQDESINEQRPIPMDTPNEFVYMDFKKWVYKNRKMVKKMMLKQKGDSTKMFLILSALWYKWARKNAPMFTFMKDDKKFGRQLMILMVDDDLIFDKETFKKTNRINQVKEIYYDNLGKKCPGPVTLDGRCLHGRNTYQKEGVGMNRTLHKDVGPHDDELNEVGIFKISQFTKGIIPPGRLDTSTPEEKKNSIKLIKNFHSMLNAFWRENDIPYRARLR